MNIESLIVYLCFVNKRDIPYSWNSQYTYLSSPVHIKGVKMQFLHAMGTLNWYAIGIYLFIWVLRGFQHCTGHITTGSWKGRGNQYIEFVWVLYCKLLTNGKELPAFPLEGVWGSNPGLRGGRRECYHSATVAPCSTM